MGILAMLLLWESQEGVVVGLSLPIVCVVSCVLGSCWPFASFAVAVLLNPPALHSVFTPIVAQNVSSQLADVRRACRLSLASSSVPRKRLRTQKGLPAPHRLQRSKVQTAFGPKRPPGGAGPGRLVSDTPPPRPFSPNSAPPPASLRPRPFSPNGVCVVWAVPPSGPPAQPPRSSGEIECLGF